jgi:hypothetical protein
LRDKPHAEFSGYKSTSSLPRTVKAENTIILMAFPDDHAEMSVLTAKKSRIGQMSSRYELLQL